MPEVTSYAVVFIFPETISCNDCCGKNISNNFITTKRGTNFMFAILDLFGHVSVCCTATV